MKSRITKNECPRFTILELLIVIAIIVMLAGLLLPALKNAKQAGYLSACANNQKQITMGITMYTLDSDGSYLHNRIDYGDDNTEYWRWTTRIVKDYNISGMVFLCPARPDHSITTTAPSNRAFWQVAAKYKAGNTIYFWQFPSYGYNYFYIGGDLFGSGRPAKAGQLTRPAATVLIGESASLERNTAAKLEAGGCSLAPYPYSPGSGTVARPVHGFKCLIGWIDGHVSPATASVSAGESAVQSLYQTNQLGKGSDTENCWTRDGKRNWF